MENRSILTGCVNKIVISKPSASAFYPLFQQAVLLALKEQNTINEIQYQQCLGRLSNQLATLN